jgi:cation:H+ antiporter
VITINSIISALNPATQSFPEVTFGCAVAFMVLMMVTEWVSDALTTLCLGFKVEPLFVGMVVVGVLGALPELMFIYFMARDVGTAAAIGGIIGGGWMTVAVPLGIAAIQMPLASRERFVAWDLPLLTMGIITFIFVCLSGELNFGKGVTAAVFGALYLLLRYYFGKKSRYGLTTFGSSFMFGASTYGTFVRLVMGLIFMIGCSFYLGLAVSSIMERLALPSLAVGFTIMVPFVFPEVSFALSALKKGHSELILGQGLGKATVILIFGIAILGFIGSQPDPNVINFIFVAFVAMLLVIWLFAKTTARLNQFQGLVLVGLTLIALGILWAQGYGKLMWLGLPKSIGF